MFIDAMRWRSDAARVNRAWVCIRPLGPRRCHAVGSKCCPATITRRVSPPAMSSRRPTVCRTLDRWPRPRAANVSVSTARTSRSPTATPNTCVAVSPAGSLAVTVTLAAPATTAVRVRVVPATVTVAAAGSDDSAA